MKPSSNSTSCMASTVLTSHPATGFNAKSSDMSGLRDLVVWERKFITDAPDTYSA